MKNANYILIRESEIKRQREREEEKGIQLSSFCEVSVLDSFNGSVLQLIISTTN
jgi:hypothetical protein